MSCRNLFASCRIHPLVFIDRPANRATLSGFAELKDVIAFIISGNGIRQHFSLVAKVTLLTAAQGIFHGTAVLRATSDGFVGASEIPIIRDYARLPAPWKISALTQSGHRQPGKPRAQKPPNIRYRRKDVLKYHIPSARITLGRRGEHHGVESRGLRAWPHGN